MKIKLLICKVLLAGLLLPILSNCKKEAIKTAPTATISEATNITATSASSGGEITADGGATVTARGVCYSTSQNPTTSDSKTTNGSGTGSFSSSITGLTPGATYSIKSYATNSVGTGYSSQSTFITLALAPVLTTTDLSSVTSTTANSGGNITNDGGSAVTARGVCWSASQNPTIADSKISSGTGSGIFTSAITGLTPGTVYYVRAYATNSIGTGYGNQITATATAIFPTITTNTVSVITATTATSGGNITSDGGAAVTARGVCWGTSASPTIANSKTTDGTATGTFTSSITGLTPGATYYIRAYATNSIGTGYGSQQTFTTTSVGLSGTVTDIDGNVYNTITIGTQVWMAENLKTTKYRNGDPIPNVTGDVAWADLSTGAYCWNNNDAATNKSTYGALYNWYAAIDSRNIAPAGWHVPSEAEWTRLRTYLGDDNFAGGKLKETGTTHWISPNTGATNEIGFTALPGGCRYDDGTFSNVGENGYWWTSEINTNYNYYLSLHYIYSSLFLDVTKDSIFYNNGKYYYYFFKRNGRSVRCVKD